jgi:hypothetical protein
MIHWQYTKSPSFLIPKCTYRCMWTCQLSTPLFHTCQLSTPLFHTHVSCPLLCSTRMSAVHSSVPHTHMSAVHSSVPHTCQLSTPLFHTHVSCPLLCSTHNSTNSADTVKQLNNLPSDRNDLEDLWRDYVKTGLSRPNLWRMMMTSRYEKL